MTSIILLLGVSLLAAAAPEPVCEPTACFDGLCDGNEVAIPKFGLSLDRWDTKKQNYTHVGTFDSHALKQKEFGWFLHGPLYLEKDIKGDSFPPAVQFSSTTQKRVFRLDHIDTNNSDMWSGQLKILGAAIAPSTLYPLEDSADGSSNGFLVAEGNPFFIDDTNTSHQINRGGITAMTKDKCTKLYPTKVG
jgi:hypothetical protein